MKQILLKKSKQESNFGYEYEFIKDFDFPEKENITSVFILLHYNNKFFLTKNHRWRELPWWHIENWESYFESINREVEEEVWTKIKSLEYFGYKKIIHNKPVKNRNWWFYPFPNGYILFYIWESTWEIFNFSWDETIDSWLFTYEESIKLLFNEDVKEIFIILYNEYLLQNK